MGKNAPASSRILEDHPEVVPEFYRKVQSGMTGTAIAQWMSAEVGKKVSAQAIRNWIRTGLHIPRRRQLRSTSRPAETDLGAWAARFIVERLEALADYADDPMMPPKDRRLASTEAATIALELRAEAMDYAEDEVDV